jgi:hypothetical protein
MRQFQHDFGYVSGIASSVCRLYKLSDLMKKGNCYDDLQGNRERAGTSAVLPALSGAPESNSTKHFPDFYKPVSGIAACGMLQYRADRDSSSGCVYAR